MCVTQKCWPTAISWKMHAEWSSFLEIACATSWTSGHLKKMKQQTQGDLWRIMYIMIKGIPLLMIIFVKNIVARSFVNLNRCNQLVINQKHVSYCLILNKNTQRIPFVDRTILKDIGHNKKNLTRKQWQCCHGFFILSSFYWTNT